MDTDVLIVGAGPTGLMLANQLRRRGVRALLVDRHSGPARETRALGVQARTLEIYQKLGLAKRAIELGKIGIGANLWSDGKHRGRVPLGDAAGHVTPFPYILILGQDDNERIMGDHLREIGGGVAWNTELVALTQRDDAVDATLKTLDGATRTISAAWVAGCDGAHSAVREMNRVAFAGAPYEHVFFVADVGMSGAMIADELNIFISRAGFHLLFPMRGVDHWRIVGIVPPELRESEGLRFEDVAPSVSRDGKVALAFKNCSWFSTYRISHRAAERFRDRRCFLLGDAAHIHSPVGAQGMNTGLQDAYNLAWKLALVVQGRASGALLDSYDAERRPVAQRLLETTDRAFKFVVSDSAFVGFLRTEVFARIAAAAMRLDFVRAFVFRLVSQTGIRYRSGPLSVTSDHLPDHAPQAGDRFPWLKLKRRSDGPIDDLFEVLDDTRCHLLAFGQPVPVDLVTDLGDLIELHAIPDDTVNDAALAAANIARPSFYLLRPDGHVGLCGSKLDPVSVARYVRNVLLAHAT